MKKYLPLLCLFTLLISIPGCTKKNNQTQQNNPLTPGRTPYEGKKIMWIDSYHKEYTWSANVEKGIKEGLKESGIILKIFRMDTKRKATDKIIDQTALAAKKEIESFGPDVLIVSDDNAFKHLVQKYYKNSDLPIVFCGINWDISTYDGPYSNTTGMIEVAPVNRLIENCKVYAGGERFGLLSPGLFSEQKTARIINKRFFDNKLVIRYVKTFEEFKKEFLALQEELDVLYLLNNAGIKGWNDDEAQKFIIENTKVPTASHNDWLARYVLITNSKIPQEQGHYAAACALRILSGERPSQIPVIENKKAKLILNLTIADKLNIVFNPMHLKNAEVVK